MRDPYRVLGVSPDASEDEIRRAYRAAARREHPDVSGRVDAAERMAELNEAYAAVGDPEARADTSPPAGWPRPPEPVEPPRKRRRRLRRALRVLLALLLLAAMLGTAALAVLYVRDQDDDDPPGVASAAAPAEQPLSAPPVEPDFTDEELDEPPEDTDDQSPTAFSTDGEGCMLWRQYELQAARSVALMRTGIALARVGPDDDQARRAAIRELTPQLNTATLQLRDARDVVRLQEADSGVEVPWQPASTRLHRAAQALRAYYREHSRAGTMPRSAPLPVLDALEAIRSYDAIVRRLDEACT